MSKVRLYISMLVLAFTLVACANKEEKAKEAVASGNALIQELNSLQPSVASDERRISSMSNAELIEYRNRLTRYIQVGEEIIRLSGTEGVVSRGMDSLQAEISAAYTVRSRVTDQLTHHKAAGSTIPESARLRYAINELVELSKQQARLNINEDTTLETLREVERATMRQVALAEEIASIRKNDKDAAAMVLQAKSTLENVRALIELKIEEIEEEKQSPNHTLIYSPPAHG